MSSIEKPGSFNEFIGSNPEMGYEEYCSQLSSFRQGIALAIGVSLDELHIMSTDEILRRQAIIDSEIAA